MTIINDTLAMGGYGVYVWPAFAVAAAIMIGLLLASRRRLKRNEGLVRELEAARGGRGR